MALDYKRLQGIAKNLIVNTFGGLPCTIRSIPNTTPAYSLSTYVVFDSGAFENIDNRQNPTTFSGLSSQFAYIPGDIGWDPDVGGTIEWYVGAKKFVKNIAKVNTTQPTTIPIYYQLTLN